MQFQFKTVLFAEVSFLPFIIIYFHIYIQQSIGIAFIQRSIYFCISNIEFIGSKQIHVSFYTGKNNIFYLELAIDRTEFIQLHEFEAEKELDPDAILAAEASRQENSESTETFTNNNSDSDDLLASLGL